MLVRCGVAGCILALATCVFAPLASAGSDFRASSPVSPYGLLCLSALALLAGEAVLVIGKLRPRGRTLRARRASAGVAANAASRVNQAPSIDDLVGMLDDTLKLARAAPVAGQLEPVDIPNVLEATAAKLGSSRLKLASQPQSLHVLAQRSAIGRAFEILAETALANGAQAQISWDHGTSAVVVHVDDDGPGIPRNARTQIFDWCYYMSTPPSQQIGCRAELVIARQILRAHGGDIAVGCSPLGGARFTARLPLLDKHRLGLAAAS